MRLIQWIWETDLDENTVINIMTASICLSPIPENVEPQTPQKHILKWSS